MVSAVEKPTSVGASSERDDTLRAMRHYLKKVITERAKQGIAPDSHLEHLLDKRVQHMRSNSLIVIRNRRILLEEVSAKLLVDRCENANELEELRSLTLLTMLNNLELLVKDLTELGVIPDKHVDWVMEQLVMTRDQDIQTISRKAPTR